MIHIADQGKAGHQKFPYPHSSLVDMVLALDMPGTWGGGGDQGLNTRQRRTDRYTGEESGTGEKMRTRL